MEPRAGPEPHFTGKFPFLVRQAERARADASGSSDEDGEIVDYVWYINDEEEETIKGSNSWEWADTPAGTHNVTLFVYDNMYGEGTYSTMIEVESEEEPLKDLNIPGFPSISLLIGLGLSLIILKKSRWRI